MKDIFREGLVVTREEKEEILNQKGRIIWLTGLSGSGKSTLAKNLEKYLTKKELLTVVLDGDNLRFGLCSDLGFSEEDRKENIRRVREVAKVLLDIGVIVIVSYISPYRNERDEARNIFKDDFIEVYVSTSIDICEKRDVKGLYKKARNGEIKEFTGVSALFESPINPEIIIDTSKISIDQGVQEIIEYLWRDNNEKV